MTDIRPSPEALDAAAANRAQPIEERDLEQAIALHRALAHAEVSIARLHQRDGEPEETDPRKVKRKTNGHGIGATGLPFSHPFQRFLDESFGVTFPWSAGLKALRHECRRSHSEHWDRDVWQGSLCYRLISMTCRFDWSYERACYELGVTPERTRPVLLRGLRRIENKLAELQARATETVKSDEGRNDWQAPVHHQRHDQPGLHASECPQCRGAAA
jgi:hypothetical protein